MAKRKATKAQNPTAYPRTRWDVFIDLLREWGVISKAAEGAKVNRRTAYERRAGNAEFARQWDDALQDFADSLEAEAIRRARDGIIKGVYHQGVLMNSEVQYSDTLMAQLLKAKRPDEYGDKLTIKIDPEWAAKLKQHGLTPMQAMEQLINALDEVDADASINTSGD